MSDSNLLPIKELISGEGKIYFPILFLFCFFSLRFIYLAFSGYVSNYVSLLFAKHGFLELTYNSLDLLLHFKKNTVINNIVNRIHVLAGGVFLNLLTILVSGTSLVFLIASMIFLEILEFKFYLLLVIPSFFIFWRLMKHLLKGLSTKVTQNTDSVVGDILILYENFVSISVYQLSRVIREQFLNHYRGLRSAQLLLLLISNLPKISIEFFSSFVLVFVISNKAFTQSELEDGGLLIYALLFVRAAPLLSQMFSSIVQISGGWRDVLTVIDFYNQINEISTQGKLLRLNNKSHLPLTHDNIEKYGNDPVIFFDQVSFQYLNSSKPILEKLTFSIQNKECFGITGPSGAGKSTIINLIAGLLSPTSGHIYLFPRINKETSSSLLNERLAIVEQQVVLFPASLLFNITLRDDCTLAEEQEVTMILFGVDLGEFAVDLTIKIGDGGRLLSGGQIQRIGLARAIFSKSDVIILDEFTSSLDVESEKSCVEVVSKLKGRHTLLVVSHRTRPLQLCDQTINLG